MVHFIIIKWFDQSGLWIWNRLIVRFKWKLWRANLNITIINGMMINPPMIAETTGLVLGGEVMDLNWAVGGWMFHSFGVSVGSSTWRAFNWFVFILRLGGRKLGSRLMQASALWLILPHNYQIIFWLTRRAAITSRRVDVSLLWLLIPLW